MTKNQTSADRAHAEAVAAHTANEEAIAAMRAQHTTFLQGEAEAREKLSRGESSRAILRAITDNHASAATLAPAIESLEASRPRLARAVDQAAAEQWAEHARAVAPQGTYAAMQEIRDELVEKFRADVAEARVRAEALSVEAGRLEDEAARLHRVGLLPRGASYSSTSGLTLDGVRYGWAPTDTLAEKVGVQLDSEHRQQKHAEAMSQNRKGSQAEQEQRMRVEAELDAARAARHSAPAAR
ncbi:hypothetical protein [Kocuria sabuli]|uniref:hypothetical protein n=1 Tax=Kocuria sabuli TaxID=3071448 RepID=UPI0034D67101